jgi:hypothetical protein
LITCALDASRQDRLPATLRLTPDEWLSGLVPGATNNLADHGQVIIRRGWGSSVWTDTQLTYMIDIALNTEFPLVPGGAQ